MATYVRRKIAIWNKETKLDQRLRLIFPKRFSHPYNYSWGISFEYLARWLEPTNKEIFRLYLRHTIFVNFKVIYHKLKKCLNSRSSYQSCPIEKAVVKNFAIFTGKHLCWSHLLIDLRASITATFLKRDSDTGVFMWILQIF